MADEKLTPYQRNLVETHLKLAQAEGLKAWRKAPTVMEKDEVIAIAYQGLVTAASRFDPEWRPPNDPRYDPFLAFGSFARQRIVGAILDWQKKQDHVPRRQRKAYKDLQQAGHGQGRSADELSALTGMDATKIRAITHAVEQQRLSIDADVDHWNDSPKRADTALSTDNGSDLVRSITETTADLINEFPVVQRSVLYLRYYSGYDFTYIAAELGISVSAVRVFHRDALDLIHAHMLHAAS